MPAKQSVQIVTGREEPITKALANLEFIFFVKGLEKKLSEMDETKRRLQIVKFSIHVLISFLVLSVSLVMLIVDPAGAQYRPMWAGFIGMVTGVWVKKWKVNTQKPEKSLVPLV